MLLGMYQIRVTPHQLAAADLAPPPAPTLTLGLVEPPHTAAALSAIPNTLRVIEWLVADIDSTSAIRDAADRYHHQDRSGTW